MILNLFSVFLVGFMAHFMVIVFILLGLFGNKIKVYTKKLLENQSLSFYIIYFLVVVVVVYLTDIQFNVVYCDVVSISTSIPLEAKNLSFFYYFFFKNQKNITGTQEQNSEILNQVANQDWTKESNLADLFINSPLESSENSFLVILVDFLTNSMYLQYISLYFSTLATIIFTCKIIMDKNINLEFIKKFIFGKYIYFGITKYISFWRGSANFWIYFALFFNWFFILISSVGTHRAIINISSNFLN